MTNHLRPEEFIDALDDTLHVSRREHLDGCDECRAELADLRSIVADVGHVESPAPSPLFWDHFSERVHQATAAEAIPAASTWWSGWWRPAGALVGAIGAVALFVMLRPVAPVANDPADVDNPAIAALGEPDDGSWGMVVDLASELEWTDVSEVATPAAGTADGIIQELTAAQRAALARLLQKEMGDS